MDRRINDTLRAGATAVGVAAGLLALATTAQTPDGYFRASLGGPLDVFTTNSSDILAIGDGTNDVSELASLLKGPLGPEAKIGAPNSPFRPAYEAGVAPNATTGAGPGEVTPPTVLSLPAIEASAPPTIVKDPGAILPSKPVIDAQGRIDCSGAVSCHTDPTTNVTTVTFPDGIVAIVQKINDLTVVAYKTITDVLPNELSSLLPPVPTSTPPPLLAAGPPSTAIQAPVVSPSSSPAPAPAPAPAASPAINDPEPPSAAVGPAPSIPDSELDTDRGPRINVSTPSKDFTPGRVSTTPDDLAKKMPGLGKVTDAIGGVVDAVKDAVGKALGPSASHKPESPKQSPSSKPDTSGDSDSDSPSP